MSVRRWRDDPSAPEAVRELLCGAPPPARLEPARYERVRARLLRLIGLPAAAATLLGLKGIAFAVSGVAVTTGAAVVLHYTQRAPQPSPPMKRGPLATLGDARSRSGWREQVEPPPNAPATAESADAAVPPTRSERPRPAPARSAAPGARNGQLERELLALRRARKAPPQQTLALLDEYDRSFAHGQLELEASVLRVEALSRLGRHAEAAELARTIERRAAGTLYAERVRAALGRAPK